MSRMPMFNRFNRRRSGFSLIEVLIAVVVLSVGLLALGALQASLVRSASEAKARAGALSLAEDRLERMRSFGDNYHGLVGGTETTAQLGGTISGVDYTRTTTVQRYAFDRVGNIFVAVPSTANGSLPAAGAAGASPQWSAGVEFKRIEVAVSWADAQGDTRNVRVTDSLSSVSPGSGLPATSVSRVGARAPQVLIRNPALEGGVIPIAIDAGDGARETAATNPRPVIVGSGGNASVVETRFDVLTFQDQSDLLSQVQKRIETSVIGCNCQFGGATGAVAYAPSVWNGLRYTQPQVLASGPLARAGTGTQSTLCTRCCADHHDASGSGPKYSPYRASHTHHRVQGGLLVDAGGSGEYLEACRMIRVDGIWQTAADLNSEYHGLLATRGSPFAAEPLPLESAQADYQDFAIDYLNRTRVPPTTTTNPVTLAEQYNLNAPSVIEITKPTGAQACPGPHCRFLHARDLYLDYLESDAQTRISNALSNCANTGTQRVFCILPYLPFTSINTTELSIWTSALTSNVTVTNTGAQVFGNASDPKAGRVQAQALASPGGTTEIRSAISPSNSGVALYTAINPQEQQRLADSQDFRIAGGTTPPGSGDRFGLTITGYPFAAGGTSPSVIYNAGGNDMSDCQVQAAGLVNGGPIPYNCQTNSSLGSGLKVTFSSYNRSVAGTTFSATCQRVGGTQTKNFNLTPQRCLNFGLDSVTGGTVGTITVFNDPNLSERTEVNFTSMTNGADVSAVFVLQGTVTQQLVSCTYSGNSLQTVTWTPATCP